MNTSDTEIEFLCPPGSRQKIAAPYRSAQSIPTWFKHLKIKGISIEENENGPITTVRACVPFLEAMSAGWIIPLAADVRFWSESDARPSYSWSVDLGFDLVAFHDLSQVGEHSPWSEKHIMKWINPWRIKVPAGWSVLFMPPLNQPNPSFTVFAGVVDCDLFIRQINIPFWFHNKKVNEVFHSGMPLIQCIPFRRAELSLVGNCREMTPAESQETEDVNLIIRTDKSYYRKKIKRLTE